MRLMLVETKSIGYQRSRTFWNQVTKDPLSTGLAVIFVSSAASNVSSKVVKLLWLERRAVYI